MKPEESDDKFYTLLAVMMILNYITFHPFEAFFTHWRDGRKWSQGNWWLNFFLGFYNGSLIIACGIVWIVLAVHLFYFLRWLSL